MKAWTGIVAAAGVAVALAGFGPGFRVAAAVPQAGQAAGAAGQRGGGGGGGQRGRGRGRAAIAVMTLTTPWPDGGSIPEKFSQAGAEVSPALSWSGAPDGVESFVVLVHDLDAPIEDGTTDRLHWLVWNIPATAPGLPEGVVQGPQLADGSRQISATGPYYRGPAAPATGPVHHYVFEVFALDTTINVPPVGASVSDTRAAVIAAMASHIRGRATAIGTFRYPN